MWFSGGKVNYTYNADGSLYSYVTQFFDNTSNSWVNNGKETRTLFDAVGMNENTEVLFCVYPNPATDRIHIQNTKASDLKVCIRTLDGRSVYTEALSNGQNMVHLENLLSGVYIIEITEGASVFRSRFIKQ